MEAALVHMTIDVLAIVYSHYFTAVNSEEKKKHVLLKICCLGSTAFSPHI